MHKIRLENTEFEGANTVYLLGEGESGPTTLIDTGTGQQAVQAMLLAELDSVDVCLADIDQILLTHFHGDHAGGAGAIQEASDATVYVHDADAPLVEQDSSARRSFNNAKLEHFERWGIPSDVQANLRANFADDRLWSDVPATVESFTHGDRFEVGQTTVEALHLPGHAAGHSGFVLESRSKRILFSGDALLPRYTPNVGGADVRVNGALAAYLESLVHIIERGFDVAYPGHRDPIEDPTRRAREIIDHHRQRTELIVDILSEHGPATVWTVSAHLFGELEGIHALHGPGEAFAHLEHLRDATVVSLLDDEYELTDSDADIDALFPR